MKSYMKIKFLFVSLGIMFLGFIFIRAIYLQTFPKIDINKYSKDMPLSEFIIGKWKVVSIFDLVTGETLEPNFPSFIFVDEDTVDYSDFTMAVYKFVEPNIIEVDNIRVLGIETWVLEREGNNLIIHATNNYGAKKYFLERCLSQSLFSWC